MNKVDNPLGRVPFYGPYIIKPEDVLTRSEKWFHVVGLGYVFSSYEMLSKVLVPGKWFYEHNLHSGIVTRSGL